MLKCVVIYNPNSGKILKHDFTDKFKEILNNKGYEPYPITTDTPYQYTIREVGGIATNAYADGRNKTYSK